MRDRSTTDLASFNNDWYRPGSALRRAVWYVVNVLCFKNALFGSSALKTGLLRLFGAKVGKGVVTQKLPSDARSFFLAVRVFTTNVPDSSDLSDSVNRDRTCR